MTVAAYGTWASAFSAEMVSAGGVSLGEVRLDGGLAHWIEARPTEAGRQVVVRGAPYLEPVEMVPGGFNARTRVHEYGGGSYWVHDGTVFATNDADQRLYRIDGPGVEPTPLTADTHGRHRYADGRVLTGGATSGTLMVLVRERHEDEEVVNEIAAMPTDGSEEPWTIVGGRDFYSDPRPSPDGALLAWICWDHPNMPWDSTELWVAALGADGRPADPRRVAGGDKEAVIQPRWSPSGDLHYASDRTGWWNLYRLERDGSSTPLRPMEAEFGVPPWQFGHCSYDFLDDGRIACIRGVGAEGRLALLDSGSGEMLDLDLPYASYSPPDLHAEGQQLLFVGASPTIPHSVVLLDFATRSVEVLAESREPALDPSDLSTPTPIEFSTEGHRTAHALFYPPTNGRFEPPDGDLPPLLVLSHGGPTDNVSPELDLRKQFWTSRGFALVDVDYGGSSGYGRAYRERLKGNWGVIDVQDCIAAAGHLADRGMVDGSRMAIRGGSAGGYTTLCALVFHAGAFNAGASYFGVGDVAALARDTHKFESRYLDGLIGPYPEAEDLYHARSPVHFTDLLCTPLLLLQGLEDEVVPPAQAEAMAAALDAKGLPYAYLAFEGEQHGFRRAENVRRSLEAELSFYAQIFGFAPADQIEPVEISNPPRL